jgi:mannose-6-phosphate isomerase-like protein (cupin superfamily)
LAIDNEAPGPSEAIPPYRVVRIGDQHAEGGGAAFASVRSDIPDNVLRDNFPLIAREEGSPQRLIAGYTVVYPGCRTRGHEHGDREEVYYFLAGEGSMVIGDEAVGVSAGSAVYVAPGPFHTVHCSGPVPLTFLWVTADVT